MVWQWRARVIMELSIGCRDRKSGVSELRHGSVCLKGRQMHKSGKKQLRLAVSCYFISSVQQLEVPGNSRQVAE